MIGLMCLAWLFVLVGGALFNNGHPYNFLGVRAYAISFVLLFGIHTLINTLRNRKSKPDSPKR